MDKAGALGRGAGQGASLGWNDEIVSRLLAAMPTPDDGTGIPRSYAAGSEQADLQNNMRAENSEAAAKYPLNYGAGAIVGGAPAAIASGGTATSIPALGLLGGAAGAAGGAGLSDENKVQGAARGAGMGALAGMAGPLLSRGASALKDLPPPPMQPAPQLAPVRPLAPGAMPGGVQRPLAPGANMAEQLKLPDSDPTYWHHNTPSKNIPGIAESGIKVEKGGENFPFKKNKGRSYWTDEESASEWAPKIADATGEDIAELRTTKPTQSVSGADKSVRIRTEDVPPDRLEVREPATGTWKKLREPPSIGNIPMPESEVATSSNQMSLFPPPASSRPARNAAPPPRRPSMSAIEMPAIPPQSKMKISTWTDPATGETVKIPELDAAPKSVSRPQTETSVARTNPPKRRAR